MSNPSLVPIFDIEAFDQSSFGLGFQLENYSPSGSPLGTYVDLTGKIIKLYVKGSFPEDLVISSEDGPNEFGSAIEIDATPTTGKFVLFLGEDELVRAINVHGVHRIEYYTSGDDPVILMRGTFKIIPLMGDAI